MRNKRVHTTSACAPERALLPDRRRGRFDRNLQEPSQNSFSGFATLSRRKRHYVRERLDEEELVMLRKMMIALLATAAVAMLAPDVASAQRGFGGGGGGFRGGGGFGGGGGGFRGGGFGGGGGFRGAAIGGGGGFRAAAIGGGGGFRAAPMGRRRLSCGRDGRRFSYSRNWRGWVPSSRNWQGWFPSSRHWCRHRLPHRSHWWTRRDWPWRRRRVRSIRNRGARSISPRPLSPPDSTGGRSS